MIKKILFLFAFYFRTLTILKIIKFFKKKKLFSKIINIYDPNNIRKVIKKKFKKNNNLFVFNNLKFYLDLNDHISFNFFINEEWDNTVLQFAKEINFSNDDIFVDVGANTGLISVPFSKEFNSKVIAIEASQRNFEYLKKNISLNKVDVVAINKFISNKKKDTQKLYLKNGNYGSNSGFSEWSPSLIKQEYEITDTTTLDEILKNYDLKKIKLIKMDIEGYEYDALLGFQKIKDIQCPIILEYNFKNIKRVDQKKSETLLEVLRENFLIFNLYFDKKIRIMHFDKFKNSEILAVPKNYKKKFKII